MRRMVDVRPLLESREVRELVNQLEYPLDMRGAKTAQILAEYRDHSDQPLLGIESEGELACLIGLRIIEPHHAVIRHIVVRRDWRKQGLGQQMVMDVCKIFSLATLTAETDHDAVEFYRTVGFEIQSLGEKYPGVERFECRLTTTG